MAGTYWLTILPDTSKLKPRIRAALEGTKVKAEIDLDKQSARKAGQDATKAVEGELNKGGGAKVKPKADRASATRAGQDAGTSVTRAFHTAANGDKVGREFGGKMAGGLKSSLAGLGPMIAGLGIGAGLTSAVSAGMDFTTSLNTMKAVAGATGDQIAQVSALARQLGTDINLPGVSAGDAANAMTELAKGGLSVDAAMQAVRGTLQLAGAASVDAATAATIQADALSAFQLQASDANRVADLLAGAANASTSEVTDIAMALSQAGTVASGFGVSIEDTLTSLAMFSNFGIKGSDAGTLMKTSLQAITDSSNPAQGAIKELGLQLYNANGQFVGYPEMLKQVAEASGRMSDEQFQAATAVLFGSDAMRGAMVAAKGGAAGFDQIAAAVTRQGIAGDVAAAKAEGLPGAWANFQNTIDGVKMSIYDMVDGPLESLLNKLSGLPDFVSRNADAFKIAAGVITTLLVPALARWIATQTVALATSVAGSIGTIIGAWGAMFGAISSATAAAGTFAVTMGRAVGAAVLGGVRAAITGVASIAASLWSAVTAAAAYAVSMARATAASIVSGLGMMVTAIRNLSIGTRVAAAAQAAFNLVMMANPIGLIIAAVAALAAGLVWFFTKTELGQRIWKGFTEYLKTAWESIKAAFSAAWTIIGGIFDAMVTKAGQVWDGVKSKFTSVVDFVKGLPSKIASAATGLWDGLKSGLVGVLNWIGDKWNSFASSLSIDLPGTALDVTLPKMPRFAAGGYAQGGRISGPGSGRSDSILGYPAMVRVSNGEFIVNAAAAARYLPLLQAINGAGLPGYANGGLTPHATELKNTISRLFGITNIGGYREPDGYNEHSTGNALDVMIPNSDTEEGRKLGNMVAAWALKNAKAIGLTGAIWRQTSYGYGSGFDGAGKPMPDRGSPTANHFDHVHLFANETPDSSLSLSGVPSISTSLGEATSAGGGSYRPATSSELSASAGRVESANKAVTQAQQAVDDKTFNRDEAKRKLDQARAEGKDTARAEEMYRRAERELGDATTNLAEKRDKLAEVTDADTELRTSGKLVEGSSTSADGTSSGSGGMDGSSLGQTFVSGILESIGLDGTLFSNPLEWPSVKSAMAGINFLGGLASIAGATGEDGTAAAGSTVGGFAAGAADSVGLGGLLSAIPSAADATFDPQSGSPALAPGEFNPGVAGGSISIPAPPGAMTKVGGGAGAQTTGSVDNSINFIGPVGLDPASVENKVNSMQSARTRTLRQ